MIRTIANAAALGTGIGALTLLLGTAPAAAFPIFVVNECVATAPSVVCDPSIEADQFAISYSSRAIQTIDGATNPFTQTGSVRILDYELLDIPQSSMLGSPEPFGYRLYVNFTGNGTVTLGPGTIDGTYDDFDFSLYLDTAGDTTTLNADQTMTPNLDDILLATGSLLNPPGGEVHIRNTFAEGDFDIGASFTPTAAGSTFFTSPVPFYVAFDVSGNINSVLAPPGFPSCPTLPATPCDFTLRIEGGGQAQFLAINEPGMLLVFATGLLAIGFAGQYRRGRNDR